MRSQLLRFYFGTLTEEERLHVEREMLVDPTTVLDYLDLKREMEGAAAVPSVPSPSLCEQLKFGLMRLKTLYLS